MKIRSLTFGLIFTLLPIQAQATQENINKGRLDLIFLASMLETALVITGSVTTDEDDPEALALAGSSLRESLRSVSALAAGEQLSRAIILTRIR